MRFVTDVRTCAALARTAAADGDVMVHGAGAAQALLQAGEVDELEPHTRVTHLRYRVLLPADVKGE